MGTCFARKSGWAGRPERGLQLPWPPGNAPQGASTQRHAGRSTMPLKKHVHEHPGNPPTRSQRQSLTGSTGSRTPRSRMARQLHTARQFADPRVRQYKAGSAGASRHRQAYQERQLAYPWVRSAPGAPHYIDDFVEVPRAGLRSPTSVARLAGFRAAVTRTPRGAVQSTAAGHASPKQ